MLTLKVNVVETKTLLESGDLLGALTPILERLVSPGHFLIGDELANGWLNLRGDEEEFSKLRDRYIIKCLRSKLETPTESWELIVLTIPDLLDIMSVDEVLEVIGSLVSQDIYL